ncbi:SGNH/GDSL hydrolase family protein [Nakamurella sp. A5-74]|uniref:SGNH/GDSL hydrolase family protein n=1 Tax=Nakamurella sp. A5-74 TaxID=3158264 RepID=A0AAU8DKZ0_9ACTN
MHGILSTLHDLRPVQGTVTAVIGYWNVGWSGAVGRAQGVVYVRNARLLTDAVNQVLERASAAGGAVYVDAYAAFGSDDSTTTDLLTDDGDHPNDRGHDALARAVVSAVRAAGR